MKKFIFPVLILVLFWLALSGHYNFLLLFLGIVSILGVVYITNRMDEADHEGRQFEYLSWRFIVYLFWMVKEIFVANLIVARMILSPNTSLQPTIAKLPVDNMTNMEKVLYANSITLTPGTLTLEVKDDWIEVHTVRPDLLESLERGEMSDRVRSVTMHSSRVNS